MSDSKRPARLHRPPGDGEALTLRDALDLLGHLPHEHCPAETPGFAPRVWMMLQRTRMFGSTCLIIVDLPADSLSEVRLLREVNRCAHAQRIRVVPRRRDDRAPRPGSLRAVPRSHEPTEGRAAPPLDR